MPDNERLREHPRERLAAEILRLDLAELTATLRAEDHAAIAGHRQITLLRRGPMTVVLFVFEPGGQLPEHQAPGDIIIHVLSGQMDVTVADETVSLSGGQLLALAPQQPHAVQARTDAAMLLTVLKSAAAPA